ncbi:hypothetical protein ACSBR2_042004 [Camellia fascicularis]
MASRTKKPRARETGQSSNPQQEYPTSKFLSLAHEKAFPAMLSRSIISGRRVNLAPKYDALLVNKLAAMGWQNLVNLPQKFSHFAWVQTERKSGGLGDLKYPLISDFTKSISKSYGVLIPDQGKFGFVFHFNFGSHWCYQEGKERRHKTILSISFMKDVVMID